MISQLFVTVTVSTPRGHEIVTVSTDQDAGVVKAMERHHNGRDCMYTVDEILVKWRSHYRTLRLSSCSAATAQIRASVRTPSAG